jgi:hypothetical protein
MTEDLDALIKAALNGKEAEPETNIHKREVRAYIGLAGIKEGPNPIPFTVIWQHFKKTMPRAHTGRRFFATAFRQFFQIHRTSRGVYYKLDPAPFGLPLSYSYFSDMKFYKKAKGKPRKYAIKEETETKEAKEQVEYQEYLETCYRQAKDSKK